MRRILFVDDEPQILEGLRVRLHRLRSAWYMEFVDSGQKAIEVMTTSPFDVIVSDLRMPEMDGATLLKQVLERWPTTVRIVLSGYAELEQSVRLVPVAHQYICKPCDVKQLENVIGRCVSLQLLLQRPALRELVGRLRRLPPVPSIYAELQRAMASDQTSVSEIAHIVERDTVISAKLLQMVNSGFFRLPRRLTSIEQAVGYLGLTTVRNLVVSAEVFAKWPPQTTPPPLKLDTLQHHASRVATIIRALMGNTLAANDALLAALLHDIGYWVLSQENVQGLVEAQRLAARESIPLDVAERRVLGASHAEVGAYLLGIWGFPTPIVEAVAHHHAPANVEQHEFDALAALCVAHALATPAEHEAFNGVVAHSEIDAGYLETVHAPFTWDEAKAHAAAASAEGASPP